jgi:hypothetical protein
MSKIKQLERKLSERLGYSSYSILFRDIFGRGRPKRAAAINPRGVYVVEYGRVSPIPPAVGGGAGSGRRIVTRGEKHLKF